MIQAVVTDFSRVLLFPLDPSYSGGLNELNNRLLQSDPDYDFWSLFTLNEQLLGYYAALDLPVYVFTSETIQEHKAVVNKLQGAFSGIFSAKHLGVAKTDKQAYERLSIELGITTDGILYIDDNKDNVAAAKSAGCITVLYLSNEDVYSKLRMK